MICINYDILIVGDLTDISNVIMDVSLSLIISARRMMASNGESSCNKFKMYDKKKKNHNM